MDEEVAILEAIRKGFKPHKTSNTMQAQFFRLNERKLDALIKATTNDMQKAESAMLRMANDQYRKVIFNAQVYANTGAGTYEQAVDMATRDFLSRGINCVEYKNGARVNIASYAAMAIRTANARAYFQGEGEKRREWGISTVIVNRRGHACLKCLKWVGKVLIDDVWSDGKASDGPYPLMSTAMEQGLYHPNCKDGHTTYFPGITDEAEPLTRKEIDNSVEAAKEEQKQQYAQRQADKFDRLASYSLDEDNQKKYATRREEWKKRYAEKMEADLSYYGNDKLSEYDIHVDICDTKYVEEAKEQINLLEELLKQYDSTMVSYQIKPSASLGESGMAYMINGKTAVSVDVKSIRKNTLARDTLNLGERQHLGTTCHEFAHTLSQSRENVNLEFWKEIKSVRTQYRKELKAIEKAEYVNKTLTAKEAQIARKRMYISDYANKDIDEFFAEAFTQAKLGETPSEYAKKVEAVADKYFGKSVVKQRESGIIKSGTLSGALTDKNDPLYEKRNKHAKSYYDSIRNSKKNDIINTIAGNTGIAKSDISKIYDHVFINEYELYGGKRRFDPDYDMAESFRRLREGKEIQEHDLIMLRHEQLEYELMNKKGLSYQEAHNIAESKYNYRRALDEFNQKNGL